MLAILLADLVDALERVLSGQSGVALGLILGGLLSAIGLRLYVNTIGSKMDAQLEATNRLCRTVANLLLASDLQSCRENGRETLAELNEALKK